MRTERPRYARLTWRDRYGEITRPLPVTSACPYCGGTRRNRVGSPGTCTSFDFTPVECIECSPQVWYALPLHEPEEPPRTGLRALLAFLWRLLWGRS